MGPATTSVPGNEVRAPPRMTLSKKRRLQSLVRASILFSLILATGCRSKTPSTLPDLTLRDVRGGEFRLRSVPGQPLLVAFLQTVPDTADTPSRSQVVFLNSMAQQYSPRGLRVALVDASVLADGSQPSHNAVLNTSYDWQLKIPLLIDQDGRLRRKLGLKELPTTFLVSADGRILHEWCGFTRPAVLALGIEKLLGGPLAKSP